MQIARGLEAIFYAQYRLALATAGTYRLLQFDLKNFYQQPGQALEIRANPCKLARGCAISIHALECDVCFLGGAA
jgi:hypothetical protein